MPDGIELNKTKVNLTIQNVVACAAILIGLGAAWQNLKTDISDNKKSSEANNLTVNTALQENNKRMDEFSKNQQNDHDLLTGLKAVWDAKKP